MRNAHAPLIVGLFLFLIVALLTIYDYGITWDEPRNYFRGRVTLNAVLFGDLRFFDHPRSLRIPSALPFDADPVFAAYPTFPSTVASVFSYIFAEKLQLLHPVAAHRVIIIGFGALGITALYSLALTLGLSRTAALVSALILAVTPVYVGHSHVNIKDIPGAAMFILSALFIIRALRRNTSSGTLIAGVIVGLTAASKLSAILVVPMVVIWYAFTFRVHRNKLAASRLIRTIIIVLLVSGGIFLISWPWLLIRPVDHLLAAYRYGSLVGLGLPTRILGDNTIIGPSTAQYYGIVYTLIQNSESVLIMSLLGFVLVVFSVYKRTRQFGLLTLPFWWAFFTFARYFLFRTSIYNGTRHILDIHAALALACGVAFHLLHRHASRSTPIFRWVAYGLTAIILLQYVSADIRLHPYQALYFNQTSGGLKNAADNHEFDYWGFSVQEMVSYLNSLPGSRDITASVNWIDPATEYFPDNHITLVPSDKPFQYIIIPHSMNYFSGALQYWKNNGTLIYTVTRDGASIGHVYRTGR